MKHQTQEAIGAFGEEESVTSPNQVGSALNKTFPKANPLKKHEIKIFHSITDKLLHMCK